MVNIVTFLKITIIKISDLYPFFKVLNTPLKNIVH